MLLLGVDFLHTLLDKQNFSAKMVLNARGVIIFPTAREHREMKADGISYEDNYKGNALAAMLAPGRLEIRYHQDFSDAEVARIVGLLLSHPDLASLASWQVTY